MRLLNRVWQGLLLILLVVTSGIAVYALTEINALKAAVAAVQTEIAPPPSYAMWSVGTGGDDGVNPYIEWVALYPESTLYPIPGAPSLRFSDQAPDSPDRSRSFEIGFYKYGPTMYTRNRIIEFWMGDGNGGIFSIAGNDNGGGQLQVRNPTDTDSVKVDFTDAGAPRISTETGIALRFRARDGLIAESYQTFEEGIGIRAASGYAGQVIDGGWRGGRLTIPNSVVRADSLILITPLSPPQGQWWIAAVDPGQSFTLASTNSAEDMDFNWLIVGVE